MPKLIRITTVPMALRYLLPGQMHYFREQGFDVLMISADGKELQEVIEKEGCPHIIVPMTRKITPLKDFYCLLKLIFIFLKHRPDIVHTHTPKAGLLGMIAAKICFVKLRIHTVAGMPMMVEEGFKFKLLKTIERITYAAANHVWPNSFSLLNYIKKLKLTSNSKLKIIGRGSSNGINLERFNHNKLDNALFKTVEKSIDYDPINTYLLTIGRLVKDKGITEIVTAFKALEPQYDALKLILVGTFENALDPLPEETLAEIHNNPNIIHIGWTPYVEYYMALANVFVFASHREGFPNVLLQAGALKIPIVCSAIPGNVDIVEDEVTGYSFACGDIGEMKTKIKYVLDTPEYVYELTERLFANINNYYSQDIFWKTLHNEYLTLLNKNGK
jgi:glycosyltransferase involved in cell wall biosynthesis